MVSPVPTTGGVGSLQRTQAPVPKQKANQEIAQAVLNRSADAGKSSSTSLNLASANAAPNSNLPRGSIVDKLV